jgi:D-alanyl-D-alanine carboxypeptidase
VTVRHTLAGGAVVLAMASAGCTLAAPGIDSAPARSPARAKATAQSVRDRTAPRAAARPAFTFSATRLGPSTRWRMTDSSWHPGCPVPLADLRLLRIGYWGFDRRPRVGRMIVAASAVAPVRGAFGDLFRARFPIRRMRLVDDYGASDYASIEADNTSAFNCRFATGSSRFSEHAYGRAVDVNPIENPYVYPNGTTVHAASRPYLDRSRHRRGMAYRGGVLVRAFTAAGWKWGGGWRRPSATDYQHFSATGR